MINIGRVRDGEYIQDKTSWEISSLETRCCDKILTESEMVSIYKIKHLGK